MFAPFNKRGNVQRFVRSHVWGAHLCICRGKHWCVCVELAFLFQSYAERLQLGSPWPVAVHQCSNDELCVTDVKQSIIGKKKPSTTKKGVGYTPFSTQTGGSA